MKSSARVVVIGGGVVGASVLYHLTKAGWTDVVLVERKQLTAGSTWHAAGGMHTLNGDPNVARLQQYTVNLYKEIEKESGQNCGIHLPGGLMLADTPERLDFLRMAQARGRYLGMHMEMLSMKEAKALNPLLEEKYFVGALYDEDEGSVDPYGVTHAYAICAKKLGAEVYTDTWVTGLNHRPDGTWDVITDQDHTIHAEHVVNAGGLWAREVGRMCGLELPVLAMEHHYLMTEPMDEVIEYNKTMGRELPHIIDFAGEIYARQEGQSILLGTYEQENRPWAAKETPWDFVFQLLPHDLERIAPELERGFAHFPAVGRAGIKKFVNGPFTFSPDGNPLVGPIRGMRGMWSACGVMAGLSQGGGVGLSLANWMVNGDPGADIWGMDVARYGDYATLAYTHAKVRENYSRRFRITFPNEELRAARPLLTTPIYDRLLEHNAVMGVGFGLEHPLWFQDKDKEPIEEVTFYRSSAFNNVGEESRAVRERVGFSEASNFAKYKVSGPGSAAWLQGLFTNALPKIGRTVLTAMLNPQGRIEGEFSVSRIGEEEFFLFGSQAAEVHHPRWFLAHLPEGSPIRFETLALSMVGLTVAGPRSRDVLQKLTDTSLATKDFPFMSFRRVNIGMAPVWLSRMTYTGDLGYEIWIAPEYQRYLFDLIWDAGKEFDMRMFGFRALITMRLEKNFGTWYREFRPIYTPLESGMERAMKFDHEFIGRAAVEAEMKTGPARKLVMFRVDVDKDKPADVLGDEPVFHNGEVVGWITSGGYAHYSGVSLALGYIPAALAAEGTTGFEIEIIGNMRPAHLQLEPVLDPSGSRMRA
ncbi:MAG: glycine cleavage system protein T [Acidimicrobiia bacterium BACL6 MAG-120924-bin43]|jgi:dimethylglycine dehydrogenase|uniref:Glycine cleavage system protein T n=1 Tax=Acidimicrobiia bacterium BACL6 MAG-120924-bin43 TaxID=1655583 RepID=A0A0R2QM30_9ACTN|nr:MAG: glycine cleavage system protein T [Acidimicrobiia bacterium BACL6 MAG-120924-bin43]